MKEKEIKKIKKSVRRACWLVLCLILSWGFCQRQLTLPSEPPLWIDVISIGLEFFALGLIVELLYQADVDEPLKIISAFRGCQEKFRQFHRAQKVEQPTRNEAATRAKFSAHERVGYKIRVVNLDSSTPSAKVEPGTNADVNTDHYWQTCGSSPNEKCHYLPPHAIHRPDPGEAEFLAIYYANFPPEEQSWSVHSTS